MNREFKSPIKPEEINRTIEEDTQQTWINYTRPGHDWAKRFSVNAPPPIDSNSRELSKYNTTTTTRPTTLESTTKEKIFIDSQSNKNYANFRIIQLDSDEEEPCHDDYKEADNLKTIKEIVIPPKIDREKLHIERLREILKQERDAITNAYKNMTKDFDGILMKAKNFVDKYDADESVIAQKITHMKEQLKSIQNEVQDNFRQDFNDLMKSFNEIKEPKRLSIPQRNSTASLIDNSVDQNLISNQEHNNALETETTTRCP